MVAADWGRDPRAIREYVKMANADGYRPASIDQGRWVLLRYSAFLQAHYHRNLEHAGWKEFLAYKNDLLERHLMRTTIRSYLSYIAGFYLLKAQATQSGKYLDKFAKLQVIGMTRRARSEPWKPLSPDIVRALMDATRKRWREGRNHEAEAEDFVFLMTLLYTGGRAQMYGLRVAEVDFEHGRISTIIKGGRRLAIPLHPQLRVILERHLKTRNYQSEYVFHYGKDSETRTGLKANRQNAWRICKNAQRLAGIRESVHPHRFRKTLGTAGKRFGMDMRFIQSILGHMNPRSTLASYVQPEFEEVSREFSKIDLCSDLPARSQVTPADLIIDLRGCAPPGQERAWHALLDGLLALVNQDLRPVRTTDTQYFESVDRHHDLTKTGRTVSIGSTTRFITPTKRQGAWWRAR